MHKNGTKSLAEKLSKFLNQYLDISPNIGAESFRNVALEDVVERLAKVYCLVFDIEVSDNEIIGELAEPFFGKFQFHS